jgi:integrase
MKIFNFLKKENPKKDLSEFIYEFISKSRLLSDGRKRSFRVVLRHLKNFSAHTGLPVNTDSFTELVMEEFVIYLKNRGLMLSSVKTICENVAGMLNKASKRGYPVDRGFESVRIKGEDSCAIYLTVDELKKINELNGLSKEAKACRDRFLVGCFTALRISDYRRLSVDENFVGDFIIIKTKKTGETVTIPIHPIVRDVLQRNNNSLPPMPSQQSFGETIKRVCKKAGITDTVLWERTVGTRFVRKKMKKYQLVSSHTARRSGATNMYLAGIPTARIMLLTGHKTEQSFFKYVRINKAENAKTLLEHDFFQKQ